MLALDVACKIARSPNCIFAGAWGSSVAHVMAARAQAAEPAFSDDEFEGIDMEGVDSRSRPPSPPDVSPHEEYIFEVNILCPPLACTGVAMPFAKLSRECVER